MSGPWMKWYPSDWRADPKLRMCSLAARGLWADMLALMHEADPYGHLVVGNCAPSDKQLASLVGASPREVASAVSELEGAGVFSRTEDGTVYSRRMVRDKAKAEQDRVNGRKGGNPKIKEADNGGVNPPDKAQKPEARSQKPEDTPPSGAPPAPDDTHLALASWNAVAELHGLPTAQRLTKRRKSALLARLRDCGGLGGWGAAMQRVSASKFLTGDNPRGWRADIDFVLQESSFTKLLEGRYDDREPAGVERQAALDAQVDQMISDAAEKADAQHEQADHGPVGEAEFGFRTADAEGDRQRTKSEVRGAGGGLRRIPAAFPAMGTGGGR